MSYQNSFHEFLSGSVSEYCRKHHLQCCHLCERMDCSDNDNPLIKEIKKLREIVKKFETKELREAVKAMQPNTRSNMNTYSFCEGVHASGYSRWHIRRLTGAGRKLSGGIDTKSLCDHVETGWDISVEITEHHLLNACSACTKIYRQEQNAVTKAS